MIRRILVPLDGSAFAESAVEAARAIAERHRAALSFVSVHRPEMRVLRPSGAPAPDLRLDGEARGALQQYVERIAAAERGRTTTPVAAALLEGNVADELLREIERAGIDLVVMTSHGRGGLERLWLGSTADRLIRAGRVPVLLVRGEASGAAIGLFRRVVVAMAGNQADAPLLDSVFAVTDRERATYTLLHAVAFTHIPAAPVGAVPLPDEVAALPPATDQQEIEAGEAYLRQVADPLRARGVAVETSVETGRSVARAIIDYADGHSADLVALSTRAPGPIERLAMGSVADKVMRSVSASVLICPPPAGKDE